MIFLCINDNFSDQFLINRFYDRTDLSEGIDIAKNNNSKECMICLYWFFNHGFKFQDYICNGCHGLLMLCIAIITIKGE